MTKRTAGLLLYRVQNAMLEVLLVHPGGPYWAGKEQHAWSIPKGMCEPDEEPEAAARREFQEETGLSVEGEFHALPLLKQPGGKVLHAWAVQGDCDPQAVRSNEFTLEWPPRSGRQCSFPEVDRAAWFALDEARGKIHKGQAALLHELERRFAPPSAPRRSGLS